MVESSKLAVAGLISTLLRRKLNRVIDVEWMLQNAEYAREVIRFARKQGIDELSRHADRMEELLLGRVVVDQSLAMEQEPKRKPAAASDNEPGGIESQYIGTLR